MLSFQTSLPFFTTLRVSASILVAAVFTVFLNFSPLVSSAKAKVESKQAKIKYFILSLRYTCECIFIGVIKMGITTL
jgi:hypothetical protein